MISLYRKGLYVLRTILRRTLKVPPRGPGPTVHFCATLDSLRVRAMTTNDAVEYCLAGEFVPAAFSIPYAALSRWQAKRREAITFEVSSPNELRVSWIDGNVPQQETLSVGESGPAEFPAMPEKLVANPPALFQALRAATETSDELSIRYALGCLQVRGGKQGRVTGTDGRHLLILSGFKFPWKGDLLIPGSQVFGAPDLPVEPVHVGKTDDWVTFCVGPWTFHLPLQKDKRYPLVDAVVPKADSTIAKLVLQEQDALFLAKALPKLPCPANDPYTPVTIDLDDRAILRSRDSGPPTEVLLSNSYVNGKARVSINRIYLARALEMGHREFRFFDQVVTCVDRNGTYAWALLNPSDVISPSADAVRVESPNSAANSARSPARRTSTRAA